MRFRRIAFAKIIAGCTALVLSLPVIGQTTQVDINSVIKIDITKSDSLSLQLQPLVDSMATKTIVSLGEGTHGTSEFYTIRTAITKKLIEEKGFNMICFENSYGDTYYLNLALDSGNVISGALLKQYLLGIWQNKDIKDLLDWIQAYDKSHNNIIKLRGMDYAEIANSARLVKANMAVLNDAAINTLADSLVYYANYEDLVWNNQNNRKFKYNHKDWINNGRAAYALITKLEDQLATMQLSPEVKSTTASALLSCKGCFDIFPAALQSRASSRDSIMAAMVTSIATNNPGSKIIVWAHNVHIAKQRTYNDANGGGTGMFIERAFPGQYYALATTTASGTFGGTKEQFDSKNNPFETATLQPAVAGSLEGQLSAFNIPALYIDLKKNPIPSIKYRVIGYGLNSGPETVVTANLSDCYDAVIFIKDTKAAEHSID